MSHLNTKCQSFMKEINIHIQVIIHTKSIYNNQLLGLHYLKTNSIAHMLPQIYFTDFKYCLYTRKFILSASGTLHIYLCDIINTKYII